MNSILIVDDEDFFRDRLKRALVKRNFEVFSAADYDEAITVVEKELPDMAIVDLKMPGKSGLDVIQKSLKIHPDLKIVVLTGYGSIATATEAVKLGAIHYLSKPADVDEILNAFTKHSDMLQEIKPKDFSPPSLARVEWEHINRVLEDCNGNISQAAKKLGLHRRTLQRKLFKYAPNK